MSCVCDVNTYIHTHTAATPRNVVSLGLRWCHRCDRCANTVCGMQRMCVWCIYIYTYTHSYHTAQCSVIGFDLWWCHRCDRCANTTCGMQRMWCWGWFYVGQVSFAPDQVCMYAYMCTSVSMHVCGGLSWGKGVGLEWWGAHVKFWGLSCKDSWYFDGPAYYCILAPPASWRSQILVSEAGVTDVGLSLKCTQLKRKWTIASVDPKVCVCVYASTCKLFFLFSFCGKPPTESNKPKSWSRQNQHFAQEIRSLCCSCCVLILHGVIQGVL